MIAALGAAGSAHAAERWPTRSLHWIVPFQAGGGTDYVARLLAPELSADFDQPVVVENKAGAAGIVGAGFVAHAAADGYTMLYGENGLMLFNPLIYPKLPYSREDFAPVGMMAHIPMVLVASPKAGWSTARQLIDAVREKPGIHAYATVGVGSPHHLAIEMLMEQAHLSMSQVPYRGAPALMQDVMSGEVPIAALPTSSGLAQMRAGLLKPLAVLRPRRIAWLPDVPTIGEATGLDVDISSWHALYVPRATPRAIVGRLGGALQSALARADVRAAFDDHGLEPMPLDSAGLAAFQQREIGVWTALIEKRRLTVQR